MHFVVHGEEEVKLEGNFWWKILEICRRSYWRGNSSPKPLFTHQLSPLLSLLSISLNSMELHKAQLDVSKGGAPAAPASINPNAIPLAQLLKNPQALNALSSLTGLQGLTSLTSLLAPDSQSLAAAVAAAQAAQRQKVYQPKLRTSTSNVAQQQQSTSVATASATSANGSSPKENKRNKFSPY